MFNYAGEACRGGPHGNMEMSNRTKHNAKGLLHCPWHVKHRDSSGGSSDHLHNALISNSPKDLAIASPVGEIVVWLISI